MSENEIEFTMNFIEEQISLENEAFIKDLFLSFFDEKSRVLVEWILKEAGKPIEPISICPKCRSHTGVWTAYVGFNEYKCQTCGNEWEEYTN